MSRLVSVSFEIRSKRLWRKIAANVGQDGVVLPEKGRPASPPMPEYSIGPHSQSVTRITVMFTEHHCDLAFGVATDIDGGIKNCEYGPDHQAHIHERKEAFALAFYPKPNVLQVPDRFQKEAEMHQREYLFVIVDRDSGHWRPRYENDQELPDWYKGPTVSPYANQRSEQGWEWISLIASTDRNGYIGNYQYVFKIRPAILWRVAPSWAALLRPSWVTYLPILACLFSNWLFRFLALTFTSLDFLRPSRNHLLISNLPFLRLFETLLSRLSEI